MQVHSIFKRKVTSVLENFEIYSVEPTSSALSQTSFLNDFDSYMHSENSLLKQDATKENTKQQTHLLFVDNPFITRVRK